MDFVHYMWSNKHLAVVTEIDLLMLLWTDGERHLPCDYRIYDKPNDGKTKNNHFWDLIDTPKALVLDDTVLDKPHARRMDLVHYMWSNKPCAR